MPKEKITNLFSILILALIFLQAHNTLMRLNITEGFARVVDEVFSIGWLAMGAVIFHFAIIFSGKGIANSRLFYIVLYGPYLLFFSLYHANPDPVPITAHEIWGYTSAFREGTTDSLQRYWIAGLVVLAMIILLKFAVSKKNDIRKRKQAAIISVGLLFPTFQGIITQILLPIMGEQEIPVTSTFMTFLSVAIIIALNRYKLFNITESINVENVLNELNSIVFFVAQKDIIYLNPTSRSLFLGEKNQSVSLPLSKIFVPNDSSFKIFYERICKGHRIKEPVRDFETSFLTYNKKLIHVLVTSQPIYNNRKLQGVLIFANNITQRIISEQKMRFSNERLNFVLKATNEAIWDLDLNKNCIYWGEGYFNIFGYKIKGNNTPISHWENLIHPDDLQLVLKNFSKYLKDNKKQKWEIEYRYLKSNKTYAYVIDRGYILRNSDGKAIRMIGAMQDNTKTKSYIREIENQNRTLNEIAWLQSHVARAPLAKILGLAEVLEDKELDEGEKEMFMKNLVKSCHDLDEVIHQIAEKIK